MRRLAPHALLLIAVVVSGCAGTVSVPASSPTVGATPSATAATSVAPTATAAPTATVTSTATAAPTATATRTFENAVLGYRITFPVSYRRSWSRIFTSGGALGNEYFTVQTEAEANARCQQDSGDAGGAGILESDVLVSVFNAPGVSPTTFANTPQCAGCDALSKFHVIEPTTIGANDAIRLRWEQTRETDQLIVKAGDRLYQIGPLASSLPSSLGKDWVDAIGMTFVATTPLPFPAPTPTTPPRVAVGQVAQALARAFAAKDVDGVMRLASTCWISVYPLVDGVPPGGVLWRSVPQFTQGLRERFAAGDLSVTVDPTVQFDTRSQDYYVMSLWVVAGSTRRVQLHFSEATGAWLWSLATHEVTQAEMQANSRCWALFYPLQAKSSGC